MHFPYHASGSPTTPSVIFSTSDFARYCRFMSKSGTKRSPFQNSLIELRRFISERKQVTVKKVSTDADGKFDLGLVKHGGYRLLLSPHPGFKQPEKLECSSTRACTVDAVLIANPTDGSAAGCPIR